MDKQQWFSGSDSSESIPPVPAPRYKRKLTTYEDFKQTSNKPTGENVEANIMPPPRRKNKTKFTYKTQREYLCSEDQICSTVFDKISVNNKIDTYSNNVTIGVDEKLCSDKLFQIQNMSGYHVKTLSTDKLQVQDGLGQVKTPLKSVFNNIDSHLPADTYRCFPTSKNTLENRVNSNSSENSAMVVGVFLKPEYSPRKYDTSEFVFNQAIINQEGIIDNCSGSIDKEYKASTRTDSTSGKAGKSTEVDTYENRGNTNEYSVKDSEENDSGVYFSDTKSPLHKGTSREKETKFYNLSGNISSDNFIKNETESYTMIHETLSSNNSDNIDNKHIIDNIVSRNYSEVLTSFEAETVSSFHMEIASRFSFCNEEMSKDSVVEGSPNDEEFSSRKKNSGLSAYLRSMLKTDRSMHSMSPCPVNAAVEHYSPDCCLVELNEESPSFDLGYVNDPKSLASPVCTIVSSLQGSTDLSQVADSTVDFILDLNNVHTQNVNSSALCENENTILNGSKYVYSINNSDKSSEDMENTYQKKSFVDELIENHSGNFLIANNILNNEECVIADENPPDLFISNKLRSKNCDFPPPIRHGVVSTLVAFFETVHIQEIMSNYYGSDIEEVDSAKLTTLTSSDFNESINDFNNMRENESNLEEPLLNIYESSKNLFNGPAKTVEVSSSKSSTSPSFHMEVRSKGGKGLNLNEYYSCTVENNNGMLTNQLHVLYPNESIQNKLNIISHVKWEDPSNHNLNFAHHNSENIFFRENANDYVLGDASKCELAKLNSIDATENPQNAMNGVLNYVFSMQPNEKDALSDISSGVEHHNMIDSDVVCDAINNIDILEGNVYIETQCGNGKSQETSFLNKEDGILLDPTNKGRNNIATLELSEEILQSTKFPFVLFKTEKVSSPTGPMEFNSLKDRDMEKNNPVEDNLSLSDYDGDLVESRPSKREILMQFDFSSEDELKNTFDIILEKNWGSFGITFKGDEEGVLVNDVLAGGSADLSGHVFEGS